MEYPKRIFAAMTVLICGLLMTACPALWKNAKILGLKDSSGANVGKIGGFKIHYPKDANKDYPDEHYSIVVTNASVDDNISKEEFDKIDSIGVKDKDYSKIITDGKYMCDKSIDPANPGFGCRFLASNVGGSKKVTIVFQLKDKSSWTSDDIDLTTVTEASEVDADVNEIISQIASGEAQMYTLKTCPPDASGQTVDVKTGETCPNEAGKTPDANKACPAPNFLDTSGKCVSVLQPQKQCDANSVTLLDGSCGANCGANQVQKMGKCQCQTGYKKDDKGTACIVDPSTNINPPPASSNGGGSCSLIKTSVTPTPIVTPKTYDLQEMGLAGSIAHPGVLNQLKDLTLVRGISTDLEDIYTLKATFNANYNGVNLGQAKELVALNLSTGSSITMIPKNVTSAGAHKCLPSVSGEVATFTCIYRVLENKTLPAGKLYLLIYLPNDLVLYNPQFVEPKDFAGAAAETAPATPATPVTPACKDPLPVLMVDGTCGGGCGGNEVLKELKCVCKAGFSVDAATKACMPSANANNALQPAGGPTGNNCSLNPLAAHSDTVKTILALLLGSMLAARSCRSSKN